MATDNPDGLCAEHLDMKYPEIFVPAGHTVEYEYRMVCGYYGEDFHQLHHYPKSTEKKLAQAIIDANHRANHRANHKAEVAPDKGKSWYVECAPYQPQRRVITEWGTYAL